MITFNTYNQRKEKLLAADPNAELNIILGIDPGEEKDFYDCIDKLELPEINTV